MEAGGAAACPCRVRTVPWHSVIRLGSSGPGAPGGVRRRCALNAAIADAARDVAGRVRGVIGALGETQEIYMEPEPEPEPGHGHGPGPGAPSSEGEVTQNRPCQVSRVQRSVGDG